MRKKPDFLLNTVKEVEALIKEELERTLYIGYIARYRLADKFDTLKMMGHKTPFERIGEILNEFEHWCEYTYPDDTIGRYFYQDLIDNVIWYCERDMASPKGITTISSYPFIISGEDLKAVANRMKPPTP